MPDQINITMGGSHSYILWIAVFAFAAHMVEAYFTDFIGWLKKTMHFKDVTPTHFFTVQAFGLVTGFATAMVGWNAPSFSLLFPAALILAGLVHIVMSLVHRKMMPGLLTAVVLFIPIGIAAFVLANWDGALSWRAGALSVLWAVLIMALPRTLACCCKGCCKK
jgi:hypothetical protein